MRGFHVRPIIIAGVEELSHESACIFNPSPLEKRHPPKEQLELPPIMCIILIAQVNVLDLAYRRKDYNFLKCDTIHISNVRMLFSPLTSDHVVNSCFA